MFKIHLSHGCRRLYSPSSMLRYRLTLSSASLSSLTRVWSSRSMVWARCCASSRFSWATRYVSFSAACLLATVALVARFVLGAAPSPAAVTPSLPRRRQPCLQAAADLRLGHPVDGASLSGLGLRCWAGVSACASFQSAALASKGGGGARAVGKVDLRREEGGT
jgi:hypothetical protein